MYVYAIHNKVIDSDDSLKLEFKKVDEKLKRDYTVA